MSFFECDRCGAAIGITPCFCSKQSEDKVISAQKRVKLSDKRGIITVNGSTILMAWDDSGEVVLLYDDVAKLFGLDNLYANSTDPIEALITDLENNSRLPDSINEAERPPLHLAYFANKDNVLIKGVRYEFFFALSDYLFRASNRNLLSFTEYRLLADISREIIYDLAKQGAKRISDEQLENLVRLFLSENPDHPLSLYH